MNPQAAGRDYRRRCERKATQLQRFFYEMTKVEPSMTFNKELRYLKYTDPSDRFAPLVIDGKTWKDFYVNICTIEEAITFITTLKAVASNGGA